MGKETKKPEIVDLFSMTRPELEDAYIKLYTKYAEVEAKLGRFLQEIRRSRTKRYGVSSEKNFTGQMTIFDLPGMKEENPPVSAQSPEEEKAMRLFVDGRLELDNNMAERTVKPYVINRKSSLFNFTERGAKASCILFSIVETAKQNHLDICKYLEYVLEECRVDNQEYNLW